MNTNNLAYKIDHKAVNSLLNIFKSPLLTRIVLWFKLPAAAFMGLKIKHLSTDKAITAIKYGWRSKNPFKSTYFAAQAAAAEFSTGILAQLALQGQGRISMLVAGMEAEYIKKGTGQLIFECTQGPEVQQTIARAIASKEGEKLVMESNGYQIQKDGSKVLISSFKFTWWFKVKE